ncbi:type II toxin-antitoxin system HicB family antitoxin [Streptomyces sp. NBC_01795]|uniref:toxin-antitoxin system HicB family antitoxin n=1 Tax=Streptomyces sp. NBC_01795 TaxID=2975943 RepID=UPI002DDB8829|nr:toxin-antitoxin system HicB family antitoxin [Streptomyces sp. NBC_01795]WSA96815.1 type II toxin-antitoxin system HicB family antitoxin [Streptomyces sp. NBC_01795]
MDITPYVDTLRRELALAAETGGEETREAGERLVASLESGVRLMLLEALSAAAGEITGELAPGSVDVRLRGRDPEFVVTPAPHDDWPTGPSSPPPAPASLADPAPGAEEISRINLRLPAHLKARAEESAAREGLSLNAWLVRVVGRGVEGTGGPGSGAAGGTGGAVRGQGYTGWVR